jgi:hypothetical protein
MLAMFPAASTTGQTEATNFEATVNDNPCMSRSSAT